MAERICLRPIGLAAVICLTIAAQPIITSAAEPQLSNGTVVSAAGSTLVIKDTAGKQQTFNVDGVTRITINGKPGKLADLKETMSVQVTTDEKGKLIAISTIDKDKHHKAQRRVLVAQL